MNKSKYISDEEPKIVQEDKDSFIEKIVGGYGKENPTKPKEHLQAVIDFFNDSEAFMELQNILLKGKGTARLSKENIQKFEIKINNVEQLNLSDITQSVISKENKGIMAHFSTVNITDDPKIKEVLNILYETKKNHIDLRNEIESFEEEINNAKNNKELSSIIQRVSQWYNRNREIISDVSDIILPKLLKVGAYFIDKIN
ncbi:MAG: hypothetical protein KAU84_01915 [Thermoplasmatales archaeon]|nr:hypothetical protein [Thermoplasmatales archaeon]